MSQSSSQVSSGNITPTVMGPQKEMKEGIILAGVVLFIGGLLVAAWLYSQTDSQGKVTGNTEQTNVTEFLRKTAAVDQTVTSTTPAAQVPLATMSISDIVHTDIYFEVGRKGLTDEGKMQLAAQAAMLTQHEDYGVLIQGYTDQQGSASYNMQLGLKRADTVKAELINAGIAEHRIKTVSLGEEGVLCVDTSDICRHMNRRVHLEVRKIGQEHMVLPPAPAAPSEPSDASLSTTSTTEDGSLTTEGTPPTPSDLTPTLESVSGS